MLSTPAALQRLPLMSALLMPLLCAPAAAQTNNCEAIRAHIDTRMRAGGLLNVQLVVADQGSNVPGRVVGSCGQGTRKIVSVAGAAPPPAAAKATGPAAAADDTMLTECKDGSYSVGPDCSRNKVAAPKMAGKS